jgi:hypothetical protein
LRLKNLPKTARRFFSRIAFISVAEKLWLTRMQSAAEFAAEIAAIGTGLSTLYYIRDFLFLVFTVRNP